MYVKYMYTLNAFVLILLKITVYTNGSLPVFHGTPVLCNRDKVFPRILKISEKNYNNFIY